MRRNPLGKSDFVPALEHLEERLVLDANSAGYNGVNGHFLTTPGGTLLNGTFVNIGQVEPGRPANPQLDTASNGNVNPAAVYAREAPASPNTDVDPHATQVAGVIIDNGSANPGLAPNAWLYASASRRAATTVGSEENAILEAQYLRQPSRDVRAINYSFVFRNTALPTDGSSLISRGLDWLAYKDDAVTNVFALGNAPNDWGPPADSYNGIVVGATETVSSAGQDVFSQASAAVNPNPAPVDATHNRSLVDLVAPGKNITVPDVGADGTATYVSQDGTSFAAPQVTAAVALLQQYADNRLRGNVPGWQSAAADRSGMVMKAVLMNSADKIADPGAGLLLGMEKTVLKSDGVSNGESGAAARGQTIPLDDQLGTGALNVRRALNQFSSGNVANQNPDGTPALVPTIGWNMGSLGGGTGVYTKYVVGQPLQQGSYLALTLTWDRAVSLIDDTSWWWNNVRGGRIGQFDADALGSEDFTAGSLDNLDLYLLPRGATSVAQAIWSSRSTQYNVEHVFTQIPATGQYEFWVRRAGTSAGATPFAVAWWGDPAPSDATGSVGDRVWQDANRNGIQDAGEAGMAGVRVYLYRADGTNVDTTVSNADGNYLFRHVAPGNYYASFLAPDGYRFTTRHAGWDPSVDSDADQVGYSGLFTVGTGANLTVDAGLIGGANGGAGTGGPGTGGPGTRLPVVGAALGGGAPGSSQLATQDNGDSNLTNGGDTSPTPNFVALSLPAAGSASSGTNGLITVAAGGGTSAPSNFGLPDATGIPAAGAQGVVVPSLSPIDILELGGVAVSPGDVSLVVLPGAGPLVSGGPAGVGQTDLQFGGPGGGIDSLVGGSVRPGPDTLTLDLNGQSVPAGGAVVIAGAGQLPVAIVSVGTTVQVPLPPPPNPVLTTALLGGGPVPPPVVVAPTLLVTTPTETIKTGLVLLDPVVTVNASLSSGTTSGTYKPAPLQISSTGAVVGGGSLGAGPAVGILLPAFSAVPFLMDVPADEWGTVDIAAMTDPSDQGDTPTPAGDVLVGGDGASLVIGEQGGGTLIGGLGTSGPNKPLPPAP